MLKKEERIEFLNRLIESVKAIPIEKIIGEELEVVRRGRHYMALCPFHPDNHIGSFVITPDKGIYHCFACGHSGNGISFVMDYFEIPFLEAIFKLGIEHGLLTQAEYEMYSKKKYDADMIKHIENDALKEKVEKKNVVKADPSVIHNVYQSMATVCQLNEAHKEHLTTVRKLKESELGDFFSFPTRRMNLPVKIFKGVEDNLIASFGKTSRDQLTESEEKKLTAQLSKVKAQLKNVPGFYLNLDKTCIDFASFKGIGFLIRDEKRHIQGIQIRRDTVKPGESRYVWFSSAFALNSDNCEGGGASGAPGGVIMSKKETEGNLCITEGRFKAEAIAATGNTAIYVSGVSTWKNVLPLVDRLIGKRNKIYLFFDADMLGNVAVHEQLKELAKALKEKGITPQVVLWSQDRGKGFDDLLLNCGDKYIKFCRGLSFDKFEQQYTEIVNAMLKEFEVEKPKDLKKNDIATFVKCLQKSAEANFGLL